MHLWKARTKRSRLASAATRHRDAGMPHRLARYSLRLGASVSQVESQTTGMDEHRARWTRQHRLLQPLT
jgi:predicted transcriptional regulator